MGPGMHAPLFLFPLVALYDKKFDMCMRLYSPPTDSCQTQVYAGIKVAAETGMIKDKDKELWDNVDAWLIDRRL